ALTNISRLRLRQLLERGVPRAQAINDLLDNPQRLPSALLFVNTVCLLTIGSLALVASGHFVEWWSHPLAVAVAALVVLVLGVAVTGAYIVAVEDALPVAQASDVALESGHTRLHVYRESVDNVAGVATVQDMMRALRTGEKDLPVTHVMRPVHYVPETKKVD